MQKSAPNRRVRRTRTPRWKRSSKDRRSTRSRRCPGSQSTQTAAVKLDAGRQTRLPASSRLSCRLSLRPAIGANWQTVQTLLRRLLRKLPPPQNQNRRRLPRRHSPQDNAQKARPILCRQTIAARESVRPSSRDKQGISQKKIFGNAGAGIDWHRVPTTQTELYSHPPGSFVKRG